MFRRVLLISAWLCATHAAVAAPLTAAVDQLLPADAWLQHASEDLLPWWRQPAALGQPVGRFPTFRCADGSAYDAGKPCDELAQAPAWVRSELGRDYIRMQARQVFAYAVGFHLTGEPQLLAWARAGAEDIRARALDAQTGSPATYYENGKALPAVGERTAQDIAYAGIALASLYYLTRDPVLIDDLDRLHRHLMSYFNAESGEMRWTLQGPEKDRHELVAQLDPLNAYMVLVTPLLHGERQQHWKADMRRLTQAIRTHYCVDEGWHCHGTLQQPGGEQPGARHNDFGHSGKAFWMLGLVAELLNDASLKAWADAHAKGVLREAYVADTGSWASRWRAEGVEPSNSWWIYAELDQLASTLAMRDASYAQYLQHTWPFWLQHLTDHKGHEVWSGVSPNGEHNPHDLKQNQWKNGYHSMEHALVEYLTSSALKGTPATLYFSRSAASAGKLQPYVFRGTELGRKTNGEVVAVRFALPQPALKGTTSFELPAAR